MMSPEFVGWRNDEQKSQLTRRRFVKYGATGLSTVALRGSLPAPARAWAVQGQSDSAKFNGVTLRISSISDVYASGFRLFEDEITKLLGLTMEFDNTPTQDAYTKDMLDFRTQTATHDIVLFEPAWMADYSAHLEPLSSFTDQYGLDFQLDDVMPLYRDIYTSWNGVVYAAPWDGDQHNLYFNTTAFESESNKADFKKAFGYDLAPPETWDQYADMAKFFNGRDWNGDGKPEYGVAEAWQRGGYAFWWWADKFAAYGGVWFDEKMTPLLNSPAGLKALENTLAIRDFVPPGTANFGYPELEAALIKGQVPMVVQWSSTGKAAMDPKQSTIVGQVGVALVPGATKPDGTLSRRPGLPTGWAAGVPKYSQNKEAAANLLAFISAPERALKIALNPTTAVDPWRKSSFMATKDWLALWPDDEAYAQDYVDVLRKTVEIGIPDLQIPGSYEYVTSADAEISAAIAGSKTAQEALDAAAAGWNDITQRFGAEQQLAAWKTQYDAMKALGIVYDPSIAGA